MRLILLVICLLPIAVFAQDWVEAVDNDRQLIEVDFSTIKRVEADIFAWTRTSYKENIQYYIDKKMEHFKRNGVIEDKSKWKNWDYTLTYQKYNCNENYTQIISIADYNRNGTIITRIDFPEVKREKYPIAPGSLSYAIFYILCNKFKFKVNGKIYALPIEKIENFLKEFPNAEPIETE